MADQQGLFQGEFDPRDPNLQRRFNGQVANLFDQPRRAIAQIEWGAEDGSNNRTVSGRVVDRLLNQRTGVYACRLLTQDASTRANVGHTSSGFTKGTETENDTTIGYTDFLTNEDGEFEFDVAISGAQTVVPVFYVISEGIDGDQQSWV